MPQINTSNLNVAELNQEQLKSLQNAEKALNEKEKKEIYLLAVQRPQ